MRPAIARAFKERAFPGGLTYGSHPLACATALATLAVYEEEGLIERAARTGALLADKLQTLKQQHPSVGAVRSIGLFGIVELVRSHQPYEPLTPYGGTSAEMGALSRFFRENGLYTFVRMNTFFTNPPLIVSEAQLDEGFEIIDRGLAVVDRMLES
jgi:taurine--2-oxoglutarate transaminase